MDLVGDGMSAGLEWGGFHMGLHGEGLGVSRRVRGWRFGFSPFSLGGDMAGGYGLGLRFQVGGLEELDGILDSEGSGIFGDMRARTSFLGADLSVMDVWGWRVHMGAGVGRTSASGAGEWFSAVEDLRSGAYSAGLERDDIWRMGDGMGFRVGQPLRAGGGFRLGVPTGRTKYGELTWREVSGAPSGRELEWEARYHRAFDGGMWRVSAFLTQEPGHRSDAKTNGKMLFAFERAF